MSHYRRPALYTVRNIAFAAIELASLALFIIGFALALDALSLR